MDHKISLTVFSLVLSTNFLSGFGLSTVEVVKSSITDWMECGLGSHPTSCLEERTLRVFHRLNSDLMKDLNLEGLDGKRTRKALEKSAETKELDPLELENEELLRKIQEKRTEPRGIIDEIGDLLSFVTSRFLSPFSGGSSSDDDEEEEEEEEEETDNSVDGEKGKKEIEERGHKKKELKKKNKQLKLILILMLIKNKIKMFVHKLQFLVQLKFLLVATINMLANVIRLWIELKKKHKPNKVVYYENAHHQHHYDHEHIHDHDDGHYVHPGSSHHHSHHEEEDYGGGGIWPWSRSYVEKQGEHAFQTINAYRRYPGSHSVVYMNQRPLR